MSVRGRAWNRTIDTISEGIIWAILFILFGFLTQNFSQYFTGSNAFANLFEMIHLIQAVLTFIGFLVVFKKSGMWGILGFPFATLGGELILLSLLADNTTAALMAGLITYFGSYLIARGRYHKSSPW